MNVGDESHSVQKRDIIYIPSDIPHHIENTGDETIIYISTSVPAYDFEALYDEGELSQ